MTAMSIGFCVLRLCENQEMPQYIYYLKVSIKCCMHIKQSVFSLSDLTLLAFKTHSIVDNYKNH